MKSSHFNTESSIRGFTLVELMIAMSIASVLGIGILLFTVQGLKISLRTTSESINDYNQWGLASRVMIDSKTANGSVIYPDLKSSNVTLSNRQTLAGGSGGNAIVFTLTGQNAASGKTYYKSIYGYVYNLTTKTLSRFSYTPSNAEQNNYTDLETIINNNSARFVYTKIGSSLTPVRSTAGTPIAFLFINSSNAGTSTSSMAFRSSDGKAINNMQISKIFEASFTVKK